MRLCLGTSCWQRGFLGKCSLGLEWLFIHTCMNILNQVYGFKTYIHPSFEHTFYIHSPFFNLSTLKHASQHFTYNSISSISHIHFYTTYTLLHHIYTLPNQPTDPWDATPPVYPNCPAHGNTRCGMPGTRPSRTCWSNCPGCSTPNKAPPGVPSATNPWYSCT